MLVFQNCNENISLYNDGTINYHNIESIRKLYEEFILSLKQNIEQKDEIINLLRKKNG